MSTSIHGGIKINDVSKFFQELAIMKARLWEEHDMENTARKFAFFVFNKNSLYKEKSMKRSLFELYREYAVEFNSDDGAFTYRGNEFAISFYPEKGLGIVHASNRDHIDELLTFESIEEFAYWNGSDGPEDIPYEQWEKRGEVWDEITSAKDYSYEIGYKGRILLEVFKEIPSATVISIFNNKKIEFLRDYLEEEIKYNIINLFGTTEEKAEFYAAVKAMKFSKLSSFRERERELWELYGDEKLGLLMQEYTEIVVGEQK